MKTTRFEELVVWQKSKHLTVTVYELFRDTKDFGFKDQIQRASVSVMNNIAEGHDRESKKEFQHFLSIARGSLGEVRSMLALAVELKYISPNQSYVLESLTLELSKMITSLRKTMSK